MPRLFSRFLPVIFMLLLCSSSYLRAQSKDIDPRIMAVYGTSVKDLNAGQLAELNSQLQRSSVKQVPRRQGESYPLLSKQGLVNKFVPDLKQDAFTAPLNINPLKYTIDFYSREEQVLRIDGTDYVLFIAGKAR